MAKNKIGSNAWRFRGNERKYVEEVLDAGFASGTTGSMNKRFEDAVTKQFGVPYAVTSNSGTSTLHQALFAFGVGPGDEVIIPALTVAMCGFAVVHAGATPVFADVDPNTFLIDPKDIERKITKRTKAIMAVHLYGAVCDMDAIMRIAKKYKLFVLEDCAQCYLGTDKKGRIGGTIGHVGSFSLQSSKHLTCGDGGILLTHNEEFATQMRKFGGLGFKHIKGDRNKIKKNRDLFQDPAYERHDTFGYNYRLSELGAAVALAQIEKLNHFVRKRRTMAKAYEAVIKKTKCSWLVPQQVLSQATNASYTFVVRYEGEKALGVSWYEFRKKYMEFGGDGIYSAWALVYREPIFIQLHNSGRYSKELKTVHAPYLKGFLSKTQCSIAEELQPKLMQFTTNQHTQVEVRTQARALEQTIHFFNSSR